MSLPIQRGPLNIPDLDVQVMDYWYRLHKSTKERPAKFIFGWIVFNHIFSKYSVYLHPGNARLPGDKDQAMEFARMPALVNIFAVSSRSWQSKRIITLPLMNYRNHPIPSSGLVGQVNAAALSPEDFIEIMYEIRNSYVHGKRGVKVFEDQAIAAFTDAFADFLAVLVKQLDTMTR